MWSVRLRFINDAWHGRALSVGAYGVNMSDYQCPACGECNTKVLHTYPHFNHVRRRRRCNVCGRRFSTEEHIIEPEKIDPPLPVAFPSTLTRSIV